MHLSAEPPGSVGSSSEPGTFVSQAPKAPFPVSTLRPRLLTPTGVYYDWHSHWSSANARPPQLSDTPMEACTHESEAARGPHRGQAERGGDADCVGPRHPRHRQGEAPAGLGPGRRPG